MSDKKHKYLTKNKYLEKIGIKQKDYGVNFCDYDKNKWKKQRKKYGFDSRECWCLESTFVEWLYSHLMRYKHDASKIIDLTFYKFEFDGREYTEIEAIDYIIDACKNWLLDEDKLENHEKIQKAAHLWAEIMPCVWW